MFKYFITVTRDNEWLNESDGKKEKSKRLKRFTQVY